MPSGSLCLNGGVLYVGRHEKTARVCSYDLDGRYLQEHIVFRDSDAGRSEVAGLAVDLDHRVWVADRAAHKLRCFTLFGRELAVLGDENSARLDQAKHLGSPCDVLARSADEDFTLVVASAGDRRHAVHCLQPEFGRTLSLRPLGDPEARFRGVIRLAQHASLLYVVESHARRVQVFRDGEFHFAFRVPSAHGFAAIAALVPIGDGRLCVAVDGEQCALLIVDQSGAYLGTLATHGGSEGTVLAPCALALEDESCDRRRRLAVLDQGGTRIQLFNLEGRYYGSFAEPG